MARPICRPTRRCCGCARRRAELGAFALQALTGLASASSLFLVASGLTVIFGVTRIVNFAHGSFYMLGAYLGWTLVHWLGPREMLGFWGGVLLAALAVAALGALVEATLLRRIYRSPELFQLLATFGLLLVIQDVVLHVWGPQDLLGPRAPGLRGSVEVLGARFPLYDLFLIGVGPLVLAALWALFRFTRFGARVRAATENREMVAALGVDQRTLFTAVFALGAGLAGLAGALQLPRESVNLAMDLAVITEAFVVVVIGGLGSLPGAFLAALLIGQLNAFGILVWPEGTLVLVFLLMAVVLILRPHGLLGRPASALPAVAGEAEPPLGPTPAAMRAAGLAALGLALVWPALAGAHGLTVALDLAVAVLFAASLHLLLGIAGLPSFGHAAYFGAGTYAAALLAKYAAAPAWLGLAAAPLAAGLAGLAFGAFTVRLSGVYGAMLTLAFAQGLWALAFQWQAVTGGDNGILGVWPGGWLADKGHLFWVAALLTGGGVWMLRRIARSPFGLCLRATRDSPLRAAAIGLPAYRLRLAAFVAAAAFAGLAGGIFAYAKGSVFPTSLAIPRSVDGLLMVLLGGVQSLSGPLAGAAVYTLLHEQLMRATELWRAALGVVILVIVLFLPGGLAGLARGRR
jgi:branched-chain amino acid transport system permease protein